MLIVIRGEELILLSWSTRQDWTFSSYQIIPSKHEQKISKDTHSPSEIMPNTLNGTIHRPHTLDGGEVMVATRNDMVTEQVPLQAGRNGEVVCAKVTLSNAPPLYICSYYRPPGDTESVVDSLEEAIEELQPLLQKNPRATVVIGDDFNAQGIDWNDLTILQDCPRKGMFRQLIDILGLSHLKQPPR